MALWKLLASIHLVTFSTLYEQNLFFLWNSFVRLLLENVKIRSHQVFNLPEKPQHET